MPSDRSFGALMTGVLGGLGALAVWRHAVLAAVFFTVSGLIGVLTLFRPSVLHPLNRAWMALAACLNIVVTPIVLGLLYYGMITPMSWLMRAMRRDPLRRRFEPQASSYWMPRVSSSAAHESMRNQF